MNNAERVNQQVTGGHVRSLSDALDDPRKIEDVDRIVQRTEDVRMIGMLDDTFYLFGDDSVLHFLHETGGLRVYQSPMDAAFSCSRFPSR